ncbi:nitrogenase component 1 [Paenibacillus sp. YN15]|uniref:nitrogenase component 1 n=1 Tax=Paenibacillus sp. YN15 TaxID=1742774 RepID=UPI000DCCCF2D|nr:nitrogenase component 1 [Paenibacillus sp. YN15]RAV02745.1 hydrogenase [Paenibacillus sp. YN15]
MSQSVEQIRHVCALGAYESVLAIKKAVPIVHSGPGCVSKLMITLGTQNGHQGSGYVGGHAIPCTNASEHEVVFGGTNQLRQLITNTFDVIDGDLFVVLTGCTSDIIGDDVGEIARKFKKEGKPIIYVETGGFKGSNLLGHELLLDAIIDQLLEPQPVEQGLVNVWSVVPYQNTFWAGDIEQLNKLLASIGLKPNVIFGPDSRVEAVRDIPKAQFNLVLSPWIGLRAAEHLQEKFGTPFFHYPALPIGPTETSRFLRAVGEFAGVSPSVVEGVINREENRYYYYLERAADTLLETRLLPRRFITVADSLYALGMARFLTNDLGLIPEKQFITEDTPQRYQDGVAAEFAKFNNGITAETVFSNDGGFVEEELRRIKIRSRPLILGSSWERVVARELKAYQLSIAAPVGNHLVMSKSYVGYDGGLHLTEDIYSVVLNDFM